MFSKSQNDISRTLDLMIDRSIDEAKYNQEAAKKLMAGWVKQDRRFDGYDPDYVAKEAFDAKTHGRRMSLDQPYRPHKTGGSFTGNV